MTRMGEAIHSAGAAVVLIVALGCGASASQRSAMAESGDGREIVTGADRSGRIDQLRAASWRVTRLVTARCFLGDDGDVSCSPDGRAPPIAVARGARAVSLRVGGGAFILGNDGALLRLGRDLSITGMATTSLRSLDRVGTYHCGALADRDEVTNGSGPGRGVEARCFRDRYEDRACGDRDFQPILRPLRGAAGRSWRAPETDPAAPIWIIATCQNLCVIGACDRVPSCADPCPTPAGPTLIAVAIGRGRPGRHHFLSKPGPPRGTHPLK